MIKKDIIQPINDLIEKRAKELKNKIAYADKTEKISYENLNIETKSLSFYLNEKKLNYGDAASIILPNSVNWIVSCFAIIRLGCLVVPISYDSTLSEIEYKITTKILWPYYPNNRGFLGFNFLLPFKKILLALFWKTFP